MVNIEKKYPNKQLHVLQIAAPEFLQKGYVAASTNAIARDADVAKGLIFHYFKNKENLYMELLTLAFEQTSKAINKHLLTLSTYMGAFEVIYELIQIKYLVQIDEPIYATLLNNAFAITTEIPDTLQAFIFEIKTKYDDIFSTYLAGLFAHEKLKGTYANDPKLYFKIMMLLDAAFMYELQNQTELTSEIIRSISLSYYEIIIQNGINR
jgi:Transcriptional regulator